MILELGKLTLLLSYVLLAPLGIRDSQYSQRALYLHWGCLVVSILLLFVGFVVSDVSIAYVAQHSDPSMPLHYRISALWGGHSGSLLLMLVTLASWVVWAARGGGDGMLCLRRYAVVMGGLLSILVFLNNPFLTNQGSASFLGLNPLLQDFGMMIHPPLLYMGYVASILPFLIIISRQKLDALGLYWIELSSKYALGILTFGIILGSWWAYRILGWGGYWAWDPVENASLLPWLLQLALFHAVIAKHHVMIRWLSLLGFSVTMIATGLIRSGSMVSVHSFMSNDKMLYAFALFVVLLLIWGIYQRRQDLLSKEVLRGPIYYHYWVVLTAAGFLLLTLLLPPILEFYGVPLVLNEMFFVKVMRFVAIGVVVSLGHYLRPNYRYALGGVLLIGLIGYGYQVPFEEIVVLLILCSIVALLSWYGYKRYRNLAHIGFLSMLGFICLNHLQSNSFDIVLAEGESQVLDNHQIQLVKVKDSKTIQYVEKQAVLLVDGERLRPAIRYFPLNDMAVAISDIKLYFHWEWYVVMGAVTEEGRLSMSLHKQYWVRWIWLSGLVMLFGVISRRSKDK
jgi:cytochrome c-type biogenesis protein CcmF